MTASGPAADPVPAAADAVVIGAGHNGLTCAAYLARAGRQVVVVEARDQIGGCASTVPAVGARVNVCNCDHTMVLASGILEELELAAHGLRYLDVDPVGIAVGWADEPAFVQWRSVERTLDGLARTDPAVATAYGGYLDVALPAAKLMLTVQGAGATARVIVAAAMRRRLMVCHHLNPSIPEDLAFAESRIRPSTMAAEDVLHDLGAISMIGSDSQAMGRIGETIIRTWQTAHVMKHRRGALPGDGPADNNRARRYVAKYTIAPAVTHGLASQIGSVEPGKLADLVLWEPAFFGVRPHLVLKSGVIAWANMGDANASIPTPQPQLPRPMFGAFGSMAARLGRHFVSPAALEAGLGERWPSDRPLVATDDVSALSKADMPENDALPRIDVDPETFEVRVDGELTVADPVAELPMTQRYFLF